MKLNDNVKDLIATDNDFHHSSLYSKSMSPNTSTCQLNNNMIFVSYDLKITVLGIHESL